MTDSLPRMSPKTYEQIAMCIILLESCPMSAGRTHELLERLCRVAFVDGAAAAVKAMEPRPL